MTDWDDEHKEPVPITVDPPSAHSKKQQLIMSAFQIPGLRKIYVACGTKYGKSLSAAVCESQAGLGKPGTKWRWIAPIYEQAKVGMEYFDKLLPPHPHTEFRENSMRINLPYLGTEFQFWHCKSPQSLEGAGISGNIFDEAAKCSYDAIVAAQTTVTFTKGPQGYFSTPLGKNWFYRECMEAKEHMRWAIKNGKNPERIFLTAPTTDNPFIDKAVIEEARRSLPARLFKQFFCAEFIDDGSVFIGFRDCIQGDRLDVYGATQFWVAPNAEKLDVFLGIDWAKKEDYTVITALTVAHGKPEMVGFLRFTGVGYVEALRELYKYIKKFNKVINIKHDKTGVGEAIDDMMAQLTVPFEGVVFTNPSKAAMVNQLMMAFETREITLPNWPEMIGELESYSVVTNDLGNARYSAPTGLHDDIVSSMMLANCAAQEYSTEFRLHFLEDLPKSKLSVDKWYADLASDEDL